MATTVLAGEHIVSSDTIGDLKRSLKVLGSGVTRTAYDLGNGTVLKVGASNGYYGGNESEVLAWQALKDSDIGQYLCPIVAYDEEAYAWLIMRKVDGTIGDCSEASSAWYASGISRELDYAGINDLHGGNVGYVDDGYGNFTFYAIDYAMSDGYADGEASGSWQEGHCATCCQGCTEHEWQGRDSACCASARFHSKDCMTLQGCNQVWCDVPGCNSYAIRDLGTLRQLERAYCTLTLVWVTERIVLCGKHVPINRHDADIAREMAGQLPMFGRYISRQNMRLRRMICTEDSD